MVPGSGPAPRPRRLPRIALARRPVVEKLTAPQIPSTSQTYG